MPVRIRVGFLTLLALGSSLSLAAPLSVEPTAAEQQTAAVAEQRLMEWQSTLLADCTGHLSRGVGAAAPFVAYLWRIDELKYSMMKDLIWPTVPEADKIAAEADGETLHTKLAAAPDSERLSTCDAQVTSLLSESSHLDLRAPVAASALNRLYEKHPELRVRWREENFIARCVKDAFNAGGHDFEQEKSLCDCKTKAIFGEASEQELTAWSDDALRRQVSALLTLEKQPWYQRAQPAVRACQPALPDGSAPGQSRSSE
jgi:hypothetical protein